MCTTRSTDWNPLPQLDGKEAAISSLGDRRRSPRVPCDIRVEYTRTGTYPQHGRITDIGTGGALITTPRAIPVGTTLVLRFLLPPSNHPIRAVCKVKWLNQQTVGVEFDGLTVWEKQQVVWLSYAKETPTVLFPVL